MLARLARNKIFWLVIVTVASIVALSTTSKSRDSLMFYEKALSYVYVPVQKGLSYTIFHVQDMLSYFNDARALTIENQQLKQKVDKIEQYSRELSHLEAENERLRGILGLKGKYEDYDVITCRIIAKEAGNWFNVFTINKGTNDGIGPNMTVVTPKGLVGKVVSSSPGSSKVMAIIDCGSSISARLSETRDLIIIKGDLALKDNGTVRMNYIPVGVEVNVGDVVETSGMGGIFPPGIMVGTVTSVDNTKPQLMRYAIVQPNVDFKRLEEVVVLRNK